MTIRPFSFKNEFLFVSKPTITTTTDIRKAAPHTNFSSGSSCRLVNQIYDDFIDGSIVWQPDVLWNVCKRALDNSVSQIVDIGCGNGEKLVHYFEAEKFKTVGIDFHNSLVRAKTEFPNRSWLECDLTSSTDLRMLELDLNLKKAVYFVLSDVIEHIDDPRPTLAWVRTLLLLNPANRLFISTPDRLRQGYVKPQASSPNRAHVREWSLAEFEEFIVAAGFELVEAGHTRCNQFDQNNSSLIVETSCSNSYYEKFLSAQFNVKAGCQPRHLIITKEYAGFHSTGGIGTFVAEQRATLAVGSSLCLFAGHSRAEDRQKLVDLDLIQLEKLTADEAQQTTPLEDLVLDAVWHLLFYFESISTIHYADYQGIGVRVAQAKASGVLPRQLSLAVYCHGATHYLENANQTWFGKSHSGVAEKEKLSIELADKVIYPTHFLKLLYDQHGIEVNERNSCIYRYPYALAEKNQIADLRIDTIVFYGKQNAMKGFDLFLESLRAVKTETLRNFGIGRVVVIGPSESRSEYASGLMAELGQTIKFETFEKLGRDEAQFKVSELSDSSLFVLPYLGDNHPYALLDIAFANGLTTMLSAGGVPEMFPYQFREILTCKPTADSLAALIIKLLTLPTDALNQLRLSFVESMREIQKGINERYKELMVDFELSNKPNAVVINRTISVIVPVFNTELRMISDLIVGLNAQIFKPIEVIFVDDCSDESYVLALKKLVSEQLDLNYRFISHATNLGLAAARNTGLHAATSDFIATIDSDDVPLARFLKEGVTALQLNPSSIAAVAYLKAFNDGEDFNEQSVNVYTYRPIGDGVIAAQLDNQLGHANACFHRADLIHIGGWDQSSRAMWEDWAVYLKIVSKGFKISIIPKVQCLYRVRANSMVRTYGKWEAMRRLASNTFGLSKFETYRLQSFMRSFDAKNFELELRRQEQRLQHQLIEANEREAQLVSERDRILGAFHTVQSRRSVVLVNAITRIFSKIPFLKALVLFLLDLLFGVWRRLKN
jgi:glycosyltransferase involved in cell wall biosynthesis/SAM-dependent methyltransferase